MTWLNEFVPFLLVQLNSLATNCIHGVIDDNWTYFYVFL